MRFRGKDAWNLFGEITRLRFPSDMGPSERLHSVAGFAYDDWKKKIQLVHLDQQFFLNY